jgi:hypothetical protein
MLQTTQSRTKESSKRILIRSAANTFKRVITEGTNCSAFEAVIISEKAQEVFRIGQYNDDVTLQPGQMIWKAISQREPAGKPLTQCIFKTITLTIHSLEEDRETLSQYGHSAKRGQQINRITNEALDQGTLLTQEDLATLLDSDVKTIRNDIKRYQTVHQILIPTRGTKKDIGPGVTHREKAVELFIKGNDALTIARDLKHSLKAIERYVQTFCRTIYCQREVKDTFKTALIVGISVALVNKYLELSTQYFNTPAYKDRMGEIEDVGSRFWLSQDLKKTAGRVTRRSK